MVAERFSLDANVLVYVFDYRDSRRQALAVDLVASAQMADCWLANQALGEFYWAAVRKLRLPPPIAAEKVRDWMVAFPGIDTSRAALAAALDAAAEGRFAFWDAVLLAAAEEAGCAAVLSEDMHDGARFGKLTVRSPFDGDRLSPAARRLLDL
jgi:predicted nucleic acid-binding protein